MIFTPPTIILRHRKENLKKCSLRGLEGRNDLLFYTYPEKMNFFLEGYVMLYLDTEGAQPLSSEDNHKGLFFLDSTWNYEKKMHAKVKALHPNIIYRSLPQNFITAYPRTQTGCTDPDRGLATVEALYIAYKILERNADDLLNNYYFKDQFLKKNEEALKDLFQPK